MELILAIEGGGSFTRAGLYDENRCLLAEAFDESCNPVDVGLGVCIATLARQVRTNLSDTAQQGALTLAAGIAGSGNERTRQAIANHLLGELGLQRVLVASDIHPLLLANAGDREAMVAVCGTGSSILAQREGEEPVLIGGRGPIFGDEGSAWRIAAEALRKVAQGVDREDPLAPGTQKLLDVLLAMADARDFVSMSAWAVSAPKKDIAALAMAVTRLAAEGCEPANECVVSQALATVNAVAGAARKLRLHANVPVYLHGGVFEHCPLFRHHFAANLADIAPSIHVVWPAPMRGHRAVVELAFSEYLPKAVSVADGRRRSGTLLPLTEQVAADKPSLDELDAIGIVRQMGQEDAQAARAVQTEEGSIAAAINLVAASLSAGGRLVFAGAGTSGRLGALEAAECPPTFGVSPDRVISLMAGGATALGGSVEGAEDDFSLGEQDVRALAPALCANDLLVGIAASGATPYMRGAVSAAQALHAHTVMIACNPPRERVADIDITLPTGPEALPGSTRLKAGTATKMTLNMLTTGGMALAGYIYKGLMVNMIPSNRKLRHRAVRIIVAITGVTEVEAEQLLEAAELRIPVAVIMAVKGLDATAAAERLADAGGRLRDALL